MVRHAKTVSVFTKYIQKCRKSIKAKEETDIKTFFVPGEGKKLRSKSSIHQKGKGVDRSSPLFLQTSQQRTCQKS